MQFIPDLKTPVQSVPFFEDSKQLEIPGRGTEKSIDRLQKEVTNILAKLAASNIPTGSGKADSVPTRYGFQIHFRFASGVGRIDCLALPIRREIPSKKREALAQALYLLRNKLEAEYYAVMYEPNGFPLIPYLIGANGKTVTEELISTGNLPMIGSGR